MQSVRYLFIFVVSLALSNCSFSGFGQGFNNQPTENPVDRLSIQIAQLYDSGQAYFSKQDFGAALEFYLSIDSIAKQHDILDEHVIQAVLDRSEISRTTFTYEGVEMAHDLQLNALDLAREVEDEDIIHNIYLRLADMHGLKGQLDSAKYFIDRAFPYFFKNNSISELTRSYLVYMNYYYATDNFDSAQFILEEGISHLQQKGQPEKLAQLLVSYGRLFSKERADCSQAIAPLRKAKAIYDSLDETVNDRYIYLHESLANCLAELGRTNMPDQKFTIYEGSLNHLLTTRIQINVDFMASGDYELQIIHKGKVLRRVNFSKP